MHGVPHLSALSADLSSVPSSKSESNITHSVNVYDVPIEKQPRWPGGRTSIEGIIRGPHVFTTIG